MEFHPQQPDLPVGHRDPLVQFVTGRIRQLEGQIVTEATEYRGRELGPVVVRYAHLIRDLCAGYRRVVATYIDALDAAAGGAPAGELAARRAAVADLAATWRKDRDWRADWPDPRQTNPEPTTAE